jgi:2-polyprenyl-6-methoxyphenol hydroxylase-like FAD-dependent oxidoreductase
MALEHVVLRRALLKGMEGLSGLVVRQGARVVRVSSNGDHGVEVVVRQDGSEEQIRVRLLVGADGRSSHIRGLLGIHETRARLSSMVGVLVDAQQLPFPGHGHLFIGGATPVLGYAITPEKARIMVDLPSGTRASALVEAPSMLAGLPIGLRAQVVEAVRHGRVLIAANETRLPASVAVGSVALVGDAAGCCHPLSASGLASCTRDAMALRAAIERHAQDFPTALQLYAKIRRAPQRTRIALASALYRTFSERSPEMTALRAGLLRYWKQSAQGRSTSMRLLSTRELRMWIMAWEYARAVAYGLRGLFFGAAERRRTRGSLLTGVRLIRSAFPHLRSALRGTMENCRLAVAVIYRMRRGRGSGLADRRYSRDEARPLFQGVAAASPSHGAPDSRGEGDQGCDQGQNGRDPPPSSWDPRSTPAALKQELAPGEGDDGSCRNDRGRRVP